MYIKYCDAKNDIINFQILFIMHTLIYVTKILLKCEIIQI